jgi:hypothetical protein
MGLPLTRDAEETFVAISEQLNPATFPEWRKLVEAPDEVLLASRGLSN